MATPDRVPLAPESDASPSRAPRGSVGVAIRVSTGSGAGPTSLAAFDAALLVAGVGDFNLVRLSSVVPPHAEVREVAGADQVRGTTGDVAYCVYADAYASTPGQQAWAGVAWAIGADGSGAGLFVEHAASSEDSVRRDLTTTMNAMARTRGRPYRLAGLTVSSAVCVDRPVCAVVVATFGTAGWSDLVNSEG